MTATIYAALLQWIIFGAFSPASQLCEIFKTCNIVAPAKFVKVNFFTIYRSCCAKKTSPLNSVYLSTTGNQKNITFKITFKSTKICLISSRRSVCLPTMLIAPSTVRLHSSGHLNSHQTVRNGQGILPEEAPCNTVREIMEKT
jgi:hypothetical protein